jgi:predicted dehydrogenase
VGVAVVGCGLWGPNHVRTFAGFGDCAVTAIDLNVECLERVFNSVPQVAVTTDLDHVLADETIQAVVVATPTANHYATVRAALLAGKHVLCEKPLCTTSAEARALVELADDRQLTLLTGHVFLFNPSIVKIKEMADQGELGRLLYLSAVRTNLGPIRSDVNAALDLASHDVAVFNWIMGAEPVLVSATGGDFLQRAIHDVAFISLTYPQRQVASIHASWLNPKKVRQMTIVGSRRMVTWDDLELSTPVAIYDRGAEAATTSSDFGESLRISMWDGDVRLPKIDPSEPLKVQCRYFLDGIKNESLRRSDGQFSLGVVRVLEAVDESLRRNGVPVALHAQTDSSLNTCAGKPI